MTTVYDDDATENDLLSWLSGQVEHLPIYDPARHITAEAFAEQRGMSVSWARRKLEALVRSGRMRKIDVMHYLSSRRGVAYERV